MEPDKEFQKAVLRKRIDVCRQMMSIGYYPYTINFNANGQIQIEGRQSVDSDQNILKQMVRDLSSIARPAECEGAEGAAV
jgi:glycine cleavage system protein P-like pyridoxal-binding family